VGEPRKRARMETSGQLADGLVRAERGENGWIYVRIGRARKTKRFYLSDTEARQLVDQLKLIDWDAWDTRAAGEDRP